MKITKGLPIPWAYFQTFCELIFELLPTCAHKETQKGAQIIWDMRRYNDEKAYFLMILYAYILYFQICSSFQETQKLRTTTRKVTGNEGALYNYEHRKIKEGSCIYGWIIKVAQ